MMASGHGYVTVTAGGLHAFNMNGEWYVFLSALAKVVEKTNGNISVLLGRNEHLTDGAPPVRHMKRSEIPVAWSQLLNTYNTVTGKLASGGEYKRKKVRAPQNLTLYPIEVAVRIVEHYRADVDPAAATAVEAF